MKKLFMMAVMAVFTFAANAQTPVAGSITIAPKVGINVANFTGDVDNADAKIGLAVGAEALYMIDDMFGISGGVMYSQQGAKNEDAGIKATMSLDYINVPILANAYLAPGLAVKLGIQPGFKVNESVKIESGGHSISTDTKDCESIDFSIPVGLSYEYKNVMLDARYNWGVSNIEKENGGKSHNSVFQVTLGYRF